MDNTWDSPFWMLGGIFWGSIIIYFLTWIRPKLHSDSTWTLLAVAIMAASYWLWESTSVMVILGALIHWHYDRIEKINDHVFFIITAFTIMMVYGLQHYLLEVGLHFTDIPYAFDYTLWWRMLYAPILFCAILRYKSIQKVLSWRLFSWLGKISFSIFIVHWPLLCSFSAWCFFTWTMDYTLAYWLILAMTSALVITVSYIYEHTAVKLSSNISYHIRKAMGC